MPMPDARGTNMKKHTKSIRTGFYPFGIRSQLYVGFVIPIIFLIVLGTISYNLAAESLKKNYEESSQNTSNTARDYVDFGFTTIRAEMLQLYVDNTLSRYGTGTFSTAELVSAKNTYSTMLSSKTEGNPFLCSLYIVPKSGENILPQKGSAVDGFFDDILKDQPEVSEKGAQGLWIGTHSLIDEKAGISESSYALSYVRYYSNKSALIVADISYDAMMQVLENMNMGNGTISAFITADGRQIVSNKIGDSMNDFKFMDQSFFAKLQSAEDSYSDYVKVNGTKYLFVGSKSEISGGYLCTLIPEADVYAGALGIRSTTAVIVIIAVIAAALIAILLAAGIGKNISRTGKELKIIAGGDLTAEVKTNQKNEFRELQLSILNMKTNTGRLIEKVKNTSGSVASSADELGNASDDLAVSGSKIEEAVAEIGQGISSQADDAENCLSKMDSLSRKIENMNAAVSSMTETVNQTRDSLAKSLDTMSELRRQAAGTSEATEQVITDISGLGEATVSIGKFTEVIGNIASQTNLLSLNASIEAARAGEAGRGFSVVAEEIRQLADGSQNAANEIAKVVSGIRERMDTSIASAKQAGDIVSGQEQTVAVTVGHIQAMSRELEELFSGIAEVQNELDFINQDRADTLQAVGNISAVSQKNASAATTVDATVKEQLELVDKLKEEASVLNERLEELNGAIGVFKL